ncbi:unnamed protein product [Closterium sp. NIES-54]
MTNLWVLLHVAAQRDYELHSLDFRTAFLQGRLHEEIWLRQPPGFTWSFPTGTPWSFRRPVYGLRQAPHEWHDTVRTTLAGLGFVPSAADPSLFLRIDTSLLPFYVLVYVDDLVFAMDDTKALTLVNSKLQKRYTCTDLGELRSYLGLQITRDRARRTITLTQSHEVQQVLQRFGFQYSSPQLTPLSTSHSLSATPLDESVEPSGPYPELVGCLVYLMTCTRPDLAYPLSLLARYVAPSRHRKVHWDAAKRVLRYVCSTSSMGLVLGGWGPIVLNGHADASWVDNSATQRSLQGYTFSLGSGSVSWPFTRFTTRRAPRPPRRDTGPYDHWCVTGPGSHCVCGRGDHPAARCFRRLNNLYHARWGPEATTPGWVRLLARKIHIFELSMDDAHLCLSSLGACVSALGACVASGPDTPPGEASLSFTLHSGASLCFFRDHSTLTPLLAPVPVALADPTLGPAVAHSSTTLPCRVAPSGVLCGLHIPLFTRNLVGVGYLQDKGITVTFVGGGRTAVCTNAATGAVLATFTRESRSGLYVLHTERSPVASSAQVAASRQVPVSSPVAVFGQIEVSGQVPGSIVILFMRFVSDDDGATDVYDSAQLSFTLDSGACSCFFRDCTDLTPLRTPYTVALADPSVGAVVAHSITTLPCPAAPSGVLTDYYTPSFSRNLVGVSHLHDLGAVTTFPLNEPVASCTDGVTEAPLATFPREPGSVIQSRLPRFLARLRRYALFAWRVSSTLPLTPPHSPDHGSLPDPALGRLGPLPSPLPTSRPHRGTEVYPPPLFLTLEPPLGAPVAPPPSCPAPSGVSHVTPQSSPPQRSVPFMSGGGVGAEVTPVEDTAASSRRPRPASPPGFPSIPQFPSCSSMRPVAAELGGVPVVGTGGPGGVGGGCTGSGGAGARGTGTMAPTPRTVRFLIHEQRLLWLEREERERFERARQQQQEESQSEQQERVEES